MSELKVHKIGDLCFDFKMGKDVGVDFYLKSEADKVIADKDKEIEELKEQVHDYAQGLYVMQARAEKEVRHSNYKRCLAMAERCNDKIENPVQYDEHDDWLIITEYWERWHQRWLELAEKFKEAK